MATTIQSTELDFFEIKENLKSYLRQREEFEDYDFEGSALSNLLDVLAHNTHFNGLIANFALNESYLTTAQLRNSVVGLAESLGYLPTSKSSSQATISANIIIEPSRAASMNLEPRYNILPGELKLRGTVDDLNYVYSNRETILAENNGSGVFELSLFNDENAPIRVFEGEERTLDFLVDNSSDAVYVIPDEDIDTSTVIVKVYDNQGVAAVAEESGEGSYKVYNNVFEASTINELSQLYVLRESPNRFYELTFGDNNSLGQTPVAGNVVRINYLKTNGSDANGAATLFPIQDIMLGNNKIDEAEISVVTLTRSSGGGDRESVESIRKRAPFQYASQNRMITPLDYEALILRKYANFIEDIVCWGGEDDAKRDFGAVYISIKWSADLNSTAIGELREEIRELGRNFSVVSFIIKFVAPTTTYISTELYYQYNPNMSALSESSVSKRVRTTVENYFDKNVGKFQQVFRRSNMLTEVDASDPSILSSRATIQLQQRFIPILTLKENHEMVFPVPLEEPTDVNVPVIRTTYFTVDNKTVFIRNKLDDRVKVSPEGRVPVIFDRLPSTKLELVDIDGHVVVSNIGSYEPSTGKIVIEGLTVQSVLGSSNYIKVFATPANQSAVEAEYNNLLAYDEAESIVKAVSVKSRV
jgi:hypothetical protein